MDVRRRLTAILFGGAALGTTGHIAAASVAGLSVEDITGSATLAGLPGALTITGTAIGTTLLTARVAQSGRRPGLITGYLCAVAGAATAFIGVTSETLAVLLVGMVFLGLGSASNHLARYAGAEMFSPERRASALSLIVWAGTIGSVLGPVLLQPGGRTVEVLGFNPLGGGFAITIVFMAAAALLYTIALRPDPATLGVDPPAPSVAPSLGDAFTLPRVRVALASLIAAQVVMVLLMTTTPLHIHRHGSDLGVVGLVLSAHTLGMFAFSPLTGRLADRFGRHRIVLVGFGLSATSAVLAGTAPPDSTPALIVALFLLGLGWNFGFVAGSALLTVGVAPDVRARLQGRVDSITWLSSATASLTSGILFQAAGYRLLAYVGLALLVVPTLIVTRYRRALVPVPA